MPRKIAMVGTAESRLSAQMLDNSWEIWGVSARGKLPRASRWYELHPLEQCFEKAYEADEWRKTVREFMVDIPELWMIFPEPELAPGKVKQFPLEELRLRFDTYHMTSTFSWMVAHAISEICPHDEKGRATLAPEGTTIARRLHHLP